MGCRSSDKVTPDQRGARHHAGRPARRRHADALTTGPTPLQARAVPGDSPRLHLAPRRWGPPGASQAGVDSTLGRKPARSPIGLRAQVKGQRRHRQLPWPLVAGGGGGQAQPSERLPWTARRPSAPGDVVDPSREPSSARPPPRPGSAALARPGSARWQRRRAASSGRVRWRRRGGGRVGRAGGSRRRRVGACGCRLLLVATRR